MCIFISRVGRLIHDLISFTHLIGQKSFHHALDCHAPAPFSSNAVSLRYHLSFAPRLNWIVGYLACTNGSLTSTAFQRMSFDSTIVWISVRAGYFTITNWFTSYPHEALLHSSLRWEVPRPIRWGYHVSSCDGGGDIGGDVGGTLGRNMSYRNTYSEILKG